MTVANQSFGAEVVLAALADWEELAAEEEGPLVMLSSIPDF